MTQLLKFTGTPPALTAGLPIRSAYRSPSITYPSPCLAAKWGPHVSHLPCFLFPFLNLPVTASWGQGAAPPWPLPHCARTAGCPPRGRDTDAKVRPPSIHLPGTLAPPYKSNPHPHLPVPRRPWGFPPNFAAAREEEERGKEEWRGESGAPPGRPEPGAAGVEDQVLTVTVLERHGRRPASSPTRRRRSLKLRSLRSTSSLRRGRQRGEAVATPS
jgi:hypothetical protein